ncbi:MAG: DUF922 domain-containing protein [Rhodanobacter sp.]
MAYADDARLVYYDVVGNSAATLRQQLKSNGPLDHGKRFDAHATWHVTWTYTYASTGQGCAFTKLDTSLNGVIELPRWVDPGDAPASLKIKWERFLAALRVHEDGHYAHGVAARNEIETLGRSFQIPGSCSAMAKTFNDEASAIVDKYAAMDRQYDHDTDHGKSQGATFP